MYHAGTLSDYRETWMKPIINEIAEFLNLLSGTASII